MHGSGNEGACCHSGHPVLPTLQLQCDLVSTCGHIAGELQKLLASRVLCTC
jgi:hypothetical protein